MNTVTTSNELKEELLNTSTKLIQLPANANIIIGTEQTVNTLNDLEEIGSKSRRSVHLC